MFIRLLHLILASYLIQKDCDMANSRVFFSNLKSGNCSSVVEAKLLRFWEARLLLFWVDMLRAQHERPYNNALKAEKDKSIEALKHAIFKAHKHARTQITQEKGRSVKQIRAVSKQRNTRDRGTSSSPPARSQGQLREEHHLLQKKSTKPKRNILKTVGSRSIAARGKKGSERTGEGPREDEESDMNGTMKPKTLGGLTHNVSAVCFQPELPIIPTGFEDGTVRIWHPMTVDIVMHVIVIAASI
ncbi:hypothetical protein HID58_032822 [Brassica napus]|uniref:Uncharacterized protein n=1 Tax=Brassica napus TaxID=3708 RepID=A0ABQ8BZ82_BRANA|nr:hypothetical protein HID58_032822 [Brassica napus]